MSKEVKATLMFACLLIAGIALWTGITAFITWQWPIQFWTWETPVRAIYVIFTALYLMFLLAGAIAAAAEVAQ